MHPLIALVVGMVAAWAARRHNDERGRADDLGWGRLGAGAIGALVPYGEALFWLGGAGAYYQAQRGILWSLMLLPLLSFITAGVIGRVSGHPWGRFYPGVLAAMALTLLLGLLTTNGIQPLALLVNVRVGLGWVYEFDGVILGLCLLTLGMGLAFRFWQRDIARLGLGCVAFYLLACTGLHVVAHHFGSEYAEAMGLSGADVDALPQPLSPFNWRVVVLEGNGRLHDTLVNLKREKSVRPGQAATRAGHIAALYRPREQAEWRVYSRFGAGTLDAAGQQRVKLAWNLWREGAFGFYARYAVFDDLVAPPVPDAGASCVRFRDLRFDGARDPERGVFVLCPAAGGGVRVFVPYSLWPGTGGYHELVPVVTVRG
jgi:inner membrane protein